MAGVGGARPGAGRPRGAVKHGGHVAAATKQIADALPQIVDALIREAKAGDVRAIGQCLDRVMGKVALAVEHSGPKGEPISVAFKVALAKFYGSKPDEPEP